MLIENSWHVSHLLHINIVVEFRADLESKPAAGCWTCHPKQVIELLICKIR